MIGLPSCGKTTKSRKMVQPGEALFEFDQFFYTEVGSDPESYDWTRSLMDEAKRWNLERILAALDEGVPRVIVDSDNQAHAYTRLYVEHAIRRGYEVEFCEPDTNWWLEIRTLLRDKEKNADELERWARKLAHMSRATHRVGVATFRRRIERWIPDITVEHILAVEPHPAPAVR